MSGSTSSRKVRMNPAHAALPQRSGLADKAQKATPSVQAFFQQSSKKLGAAGPPKPAAAGLPKPTVHQYFTDARLHSVSFL